MGIISWVKGIFGRSPETEIEVILPPPDLLDTGPFMLVMPTNGDNVITFPIGKMNIGEFSTTITNAQKERAYPHRIHPPLAESLIMEMNEWEKMGVVLPSDDDDPREYVIKVDAIRKKIGGCHPDLYYKVSLMMQIRDILARAHYDMPLEEALEEAPEEDEDHIDEMSDEEREAVFEWFDE